MKVFDAVNLFLQHHNVSVLTQEQWEEFCSFLKKSVVFNDKDFNKIKCIALLRNLTAVCAERQVLYSFHPSNLFIQFLDKHKIDFLKGADIKKLGLREAKELVEWLMENKSIL